VSVTTFFFRERLDCTQKTSNHCSPFQYLPAPSLPPPKPAPKADYGQIILSPAASIFDKVAQTLPPLTSAFPLSFEALDQSFGFVLYETIIPDARFPDPALLTISGLRDRGQVFVDEVR
jgi:hypothetical protein